MKIKEETEVPIIKDKKKSKKDKKEKKKSKKEKTSDENGHDNNTEETVDKTPESNGTMAEEQEQENGDTEIELTPEQKAGALENFKISPSTVEKLKARGVNYLFPIQAQTFDDIYNGEDVIGQARTGTGKTLSFALPLIEKLHEEKNKKWGRMPKVLVMAPTRELAKQVSDDFLSIGENISVFCIYGGTPYAPQENAIRSGLDVLVGTPGRIMDHIQKGNLDLSKLKHVVLDEVDQMLDMGFADSVDEIIKSAYEREDGSKPQTLLFSATLPPWVYQTAKKYMKEDVKKVNLVGSQETKTAKNVQHLAIKCGYFDRAATIGDVIQVYSGEHGRAIVFCQTKREADELAINPVIKQDAHVLHGDIPQEKREKVLKGFKNGTYKVLISTDVAARGLDIPEVDLVIQCNPPKDVDSYIHRSGRTGRAGRSGVCICFYKPQEDYDLAWVEKKAQLKFKKIGGPTPEDIIKASATDAARSLADVSDETLLHFKDSAETLIAERGATNALAAALAVISGTTKIVKRSLLSSKEGYTTYLFQTNIEMRGTGYAWRALEKQLPYELKEKIMRMRFTKDKMGCVFDVPSESESEISELWKDGKFDTLQKATELPELLESDSSQNGFSKGGSQNGFSRGGRGGGRGGWGRDGGQGGFRNNDRSPRGGGRGRGNGGRGGGRGFKRKSDIDFDSPAQNKKIKFD